MIDEAKANLVVAVSIGTNLGTPPLFFLNPPGYVFWVLFHFYMVDFRIWWEH